MKKVMFLNKEEIIEKLTDYICECELLIEHTIDGFAGNKLVDNKVYMPIIDKVLALLNNFLPKEKYSGYFDYIYQNGECSEVNYCEITLGKLKALKEQIGEGIIKMALD